MDLSTVDIVIGFVGSMIVLPVIQQPKWSGTVRWWVTVAFCMFAAILSTAISGRLDGVDWHSVQSVAEAFVAVLGAAVVTYRSLGQPLGITPLVERATSPTRPGRHERADTPD